jgi:hypothetical protein
MVGNPLRVAALFRCLSQESSLFRHNDIVEPLLYLIAFGFGLGGIVKTVEIDHAAVSYRQFIFAGIVGQTILFQAFFEAAYGSFIRMYYQRVFQAIATTPITLSEVLWARSSGIRPRPLCIAGSTAHRNRSGRLLSSRCTDGVATVLWLLVHFRGIGRTRCCTIADYRGYFLPAISADFSYVFVLWNFLSHGESSAIPAVACLGFTSHVRRFVGENSDAGISTAGAGIPNSAGVAGGVDSLVAKIHDAPAR